MRAIGLALLFLAASVTVGLAESYRLLVLDGQAVKWGENRLGSGTSLTYGFVREPAKFPDAINCRAMVPMDDMLQSNSISIQDFHAEVRKAFHVWEHVANVRFSYVDDPSAADIVIGAQARPRGIAYANVWHMPIEDSELAAITRASICFNPDRVWEKALDGDVETMSLRQITAHEIGHTIGLDHPGRSGQLMGYRYSEEKYGLQAGDILGAVKLYGPAQGAGG